MNKISCVVLSILNKLIPKSDRYISIYGRRMLNDNAEALLDYLIYQKYTDKYLIHLLIHSTVECTTYRQGRIVNICINPLISIWILLRSKYIFHTQGMSMCAMKPAKGQIIFNLWHGSPLKAIGKMIGERAHPWTDSYFLSSSPFFAKINERCFGHSQSQMFIGGNPRNDLLFTEQEEVDRLFSLSRYEKVILFMPTFRNSTGLGRYDSFHSLPILSQENIRELDSFLAMKKVLLIIKLHPYQDKIDFLFDAYQNIKLILNDDLKHLNVKLYQLIGRSDSLITDFSSVYFDYLLLNKPIGFAIDDINDYTENRGYTINSPLDIMPGHKIFTLVDLKRFINNIVNNDDVYSIERLKIANLTNTYQGKNACRQILDFMGIEK